MSHSNLPTTTSSSSSSWREALITTVTKLQEAALDAELDQYDTLLQDDDALERFRERRKLEWREQQQQRQKWKELEPLNLECN